MKRFFDILLAIVAVFPVSFVSCEDADTGIVYEEVVYPVGNVTWRSDVSSTDKAVISQLIDNMVKVEECRFYMGAQSQSVKRAGYMSGFSNRDTIWYDPEANLACYYDRKHQDTLWSDPKAYLFEDTLKNKHGHFPYTLVYKNTYGYKVGPVVETSMPEYFIGKYEITQSEWTAVMHRDPKGKYCIIPSLSGTAPWYDEIGKGDRVAAYNIWYADAVAFCDTLHAKTGLRFRLPTEAEWECAARGGKYSHGYRYAGGDAASDAGWIWSNARTQGLGNDDYGIHAGGELLANELGICDMCGNVSEWVANAYYAYSKSDHVNPQGKALTDVKSDTLVLRGGSWMQEKLLDFNLANRKLCIMSSYSSDQSLQSAFVNCGFRIAISAN